MRTGLALVSVLAMACGDDDGGLVATYNVPASGTLAWGDAPFPNDLYLGSDGTVDMRPKADWAPVWQTVVEHLDTRTGFCGTCSIHFPVSGQIDPTTLADNVALVDAQGARVAVDVQWDATGLVIAITPARGVALLPGVTYYAGVTNKVRGADGASLKADAGFSSARAKPLVDAAKVALAAAGMTGLVATTTFTVEDPVWLAQEIKAKVDAYFTTNGAPTLTVTRVWKQSDGSLDALLGVPAVEQVGLDNPSVGGSIGDNAVAHERIAYAVKGTFNSIRVISGTGPTIGTYQPGVTAGENVPFLLIIPTGVDITNLPVIVFHHGATGLLSEVFALADMGARSGAAILALETYLHGERSQAPADTVHALRGDDGELGPDGFGEHNAVALALQFLGLDGAPPDERGSPLFGLGSIAQMAADYHALLRIVTDSNLTPLVTAEPNLANIAFDEGNVFYLGMSLGTIVGSVVLAADNVPVSAGVFNVPLASLVEAFCESETFRVQLEPLLLPPLEIPNVPYEPELKLVAQPLMSLYRWVQYPIEPTALARRNVGQTRDLMWQLAGLDEQAGTPNGEGLVHQAGVPGLGEYLYAEVPAGNPPILGKGASRFATADHRMIGFRKGMSELVPPALPPFEARGSTLMFDNPIDAVHDQLVHFFTTRRTTGTAQIQ